MVAIIFMFCYVNKINSYEQDYSWLKKKRERQATAKRKGLSGVKCIVVFPKCSRIYAAFFGR